MIKLDIKSNFASLSTQFELLSKQVRFATAVALTRTAQDIKAAEQREMQRAFDRPTRFTLNSLYVKPATKESLEARVWIKNSERPAHYLIPEVEGGSRLQKRFEELLRQGGILGRGERTVPGAGAKIDAYGNMSRGQIVQILSQLRAFNLAGFDANATNSRRSVRKRSFVGYFYARQGESRQGLGAWKHGEKVQHLPTGIYAKSKGRIVPVLIFVSNATYARHFRFYETARDVAGQQFPVRFSQAMEQALATARAR